MKCRHMQCHQCDDPTAEMDRRLSGEHSAACERLTGYNDDCICGAWRVQAAVADAYRRGAEAMREACARVADSAKARRADEYTAEEIADAIRALPIPEEP